MRFHRREILLWLTWLSSLGLMPPAFAHHVVSSMDVPDAGGFAGSGNFALIYGNREQREKFLDFLRNVYQIYPAARFHQLIAEIYAAKTADDKVYQEILKRVHEIKPVLGDVTYKLPALKKQKLEIAAETAKLLDLKKEINGYVEIGTPGRYVQTLKENVKIKGDVHLVHDHKPDFGLTDILERGQLATIGKYIPLSGYPPLPLKDASVDLVTNYIGFHHCPPHELDGFVHSIHRVLRPGGVLILRDHDASSVDMAAMVGLAHDVFNAGLGVTWEKNHQEVRHFKSLAQIETYLAGIGFTRENEPVFQDGDPTKNALMKFVKKA